MTLPEDDTGCFYTWREPGGRKHNDVIDISESGQSGSNSPRHVCHRVDMAHHRTAIVG